MAQSVQDPVKEIRHLQRCINDLVSILALPAIWSGGEASQISRTLADSLVGMLRLDFVYVRLSSAVFEVPIEVVRVAESPGSLSTADLIVDSVRRLLEMEPEYWPSLIPNPASGEDISIVPFWLGLQGEIGAVVAGCIRRDFPRDTERLILGVAANQASLGIQEARLLMEQKRIAAELDHRVAIRTWELAEKNEELRKEIVERKLSEEVLARTRSELANVARSMSLGVLTASIAHEINQPLSGIVTNASTCLRMLSANPPNVDGALETARRTIRDGNRASDVVTKLRTLYSKKEMSLEPMDLNHATQEVISLSQVELERNRVIVRSELAEDLPFVNADRIQLQQVILNLVRNASDAMHTVDDRPRDLLIRTRRNENDVCLAVQDAGVGFAAEDAGKLFDSFYTTKHDGMGIGLSVSRSIIEAHQGRLWAVANQGPGSTFCFSIPVSSHDHS